MYYNNFSIFGGSNQIHQLYPRAELTKRIGNAHFSRLVIVPTIQTCEKYVLIHKK